MLWEGGGGKGDWFAYRLNSQTATLDPRGGITSFTFDAVGNRTSLTDPVANTTTWVFDGLNRAIEETNALGFTRFYSFDAVGNNTRIIDRNGRIREFDYDSLNRMTTERWLLPSPPSGGEGQGEGAYSATWSYDAASQLLTADDGFSAYQYSYDRLGRITTIDNFPGGTGVPPVGGGTGVPPVRLTQTWDLVGNRLSLSATRFDDLGSPVPDFTNTYAYDTLYRMTRIDQTGPNVVPKRIEMDYNAIGQHTRIARFAAPLAGGSLALVASSTYTYDPLARLVGIEHAAALNSQLSTLNSFSYSFDRLNRITSVTSTADGTATYAYL